MESKVKVMGHPIHPMLVSFPVAFYISTFICYIVYQSNGDIFWFKVGVVANIAGIVMAVVAAIPGTIDWALAIPNDTHAKRDGLVHMALNIFSLLMFAMAALINYRKWDQGFVDLGPTLIVTGIGVLTTLAAGFYGWTLVQKYHVGIDLTHDQDVIETKMKQPVFSTEPRRT